MFQVRVAQTACMSACQHVAKSLMAMLLSEDVKQMSLAALEQVNLDVIQCERNYSFVCFGGREILHFSHRFFQYSFSRNICQSTQISLFEF